MPQIAQTPATPTSSPEPWIPDYEDSVGIAAPKLGPRPAALLMVHPERWAVMHGRVVPSCANLTLRAGANNVRQRRDGKYVLQDAIAAAEARGWKVIRPEVDGPGTSYLYEVSPGVYLSRWETAHPGSSTVTVDEIGYADWLRGLIGEGKIARPLPYVLERMQAELSRQAAELGDKLATMPSLRPLHARLVRDLEAVELELAESVEGARPPAPPGAGPLPGLVGDADDDAPAPAPAPARRGRS